MSAATLTPATGNHETVEDLLRYAARAFNAAGVEFKPARMSKLIRREHRHAPDFTRHLIDTYLDRQVHAASWAGFELYAATGYADPTGARAAQNVDRERGSR